MSFLGWPFLRGELLVLRIGFCLVNLKLEKKGRDIRSGTLPVITGL